MSQGRFLTELRRSNASGSHGNFSKDRYNTERKALEVEMSVLDETEVEKADEVSVTAEYGEPDTYASETHYYSDPEAYGSFVRDDDYDPAYEDRWDD